MSKAYVTGFARYLMGISLFNLLVMFATLFSENGFFGYIFTLVVFAALIRYIPFILDMINRLLARIEPPMMRPMSRAINRFNRRMQGNAGRGVRRFFNRNKKSPSNETPAEGSDDKSTGSTGGGSGNNDLKYSKKTLDEEGQDNKQDTGENGDNVGNDDDLNIPSNNGEGGVGGGLGVEPVYNAGPGPKTPNMVVPVDISRGNRSPNVRDANFDEFRTPVAKRVNPSNLKPQKKVELPTEFPSAPTELAKAGVSGVSKSVPVTLAGVEAVKAGAETSAKVLTLKNGAQVAVAGAAVGVTSAIIASKLGGTRNPISEKIPTASGNPILTGAPSALGDFQRGQNPTIKEANFDDDDLRAKVKRIKPGLKEVEPAKTKDIIKPHDNTEYPSAPVQEDAPVSQEPLEIKPENQEVHVKGVETPKTDDKNNTKVVEPDKKTIVPEKPKFADEKESLIQKEIKKPVEIKKPLNFDQSQLKTINQKKDIDHVPEIRAQKPILDATDDIVGSEPKKRISQSDLLKSLKEDKAIKKPSTKLDLKENKLNQPE